MPLEEKDVLEEMQKELDRIKEGLREFLIKTDSITSWVAHRVNYKYLGEENYRELIKISEEARMRAKQLKQL